MIGSAIALNIKLPSFALSVQFARASPLLLLPAPEVILHRFRRQCTHYDLHDTRLYQHSTTWCVKHCTDAVETWHQTHSAFRSLKPICYLLASLGSNLLCPSSLKTHSNRKAVEAILPSRVPSLEICPLCTRYHTPLNPVCVSLCFF